MTGQGINKEQNESTHSLYQRLGKQLKWAFFMFFMLTCVFSIHPVCSASMEPTIRANSLVIGWRLSCFTGTAKIERGSVIIFSSPEDNRLLIKRVVAIEGDEIAIQSGNVYLNGTLLTEEYLIPTMKTESGGFGHTKFSVPEGCVFVMGDNRENSIDSRYFAVPYIPISKIYSQSIFHFAVPRWLCAAFTT